MIPLVTWLEAAQWRYFVLADATLASVLITVVACALSSRIGDRFDRGAGPFAFLGLVLVALVAARWPTFFVLHRLNPDEAQMAAQAITAARFPIPWLAFDSGSSGPLNTYVLLIPMLLGVHPTFMTARMIAVLLEFGAFASAYVAIRSVAASWVARIALVPPLVFWCVTTQEDFVHYSSEHLSIFLSTLAIAFVAIGRTRAQPWYLAYCTGVSIGALSFAKLQSAPIAIATFAIAAAAYYGCEGLAPAARRVRTMALALGALSVPALVGAAMVWGASFGDFRRAYIETSLAYAIHQTRLWWFLSASDEFGPFFLLLAPIVVFGIVATIARARSLEPALRGGFVASLAAVAAAIVAIASPGRMSPHYLTFAIVPLAAAAALALAVIARAWVDLGGVRVERYVPQGLICAFVVASAVVDRAFLRAPEPWLGNDFGAYMWPGPYDRISGDIAKTVRPGERLAIWGWTPEYWVYSSTIMGTRDSASIFAYTTTFNPQRPYFRNRYLADFERNRPEAFLDSGNESLAIEDGDASYRTMPELAALVDREYVVADTWRHFRFFLRRDLADRKS